MHPVFDMIELETALLDGDAVLRGKGDNGVIQPWQVWDLQQLSFDRPSVRRGCPCCQVSPLLLQYP
jgi:hypothetical protein